MQFDQLKRREFIALLGGAAIAGRSYELRDMWRSDFGRPEVLHRVRDASN
jgi:hypothetical protein